VDVCCGKHFAYLNLNKNHNAMQVIIPVINNSDKKMVLSKGFHSTGSICVYNTESGAYNWFDAEELKAHSGNIAEELLNQGITMVVTNDMSFMALTLFIDNGFTVYKSDGHDLNHNIEMLINDRLPLFGLHNAFRKTCSSSECGSCSTVCNN
jgi:predicted Fe-Mo cluster-binding NifX family protein